MAILAAEGIVVGLFSDSAPQEMKYILDHSGATFAVVHDQERVDKLLEIREELPNIRKVIHWDPKGLGSYTEPILMGFEQVVELGRKYEELHPNAFEERLERGKGEDICGLWYTSGTTGAPKGAIVTHDCMLGATRSFLGIFPFSDADNYITYLPTGWIPEQWFGMGVPLYSGLVTNFPEGRETVRENVKEIGPQFIPDPPVIWEGLASRTRARIEDTTRLKRLIYNLFLPVGYKVADIREQDRTPNLFWKALYALADLCCLKLIKEIFGLTWVRVPWTGGAPISPDCFKFMRALGVNLKQGYATTEGGMIAVQPSDDSSAEGVGPPTPGTEVRITEGDEILVRGEGVVTDYYKDDEATKRVFAGGWLHPGDAGYINEHAHLIVIDRLRDLMELAGAGKFSPSYIEGRLKFSPYIRDVMALGGKDRAYVSAIIDIDFENVGQWAEKRALAYTTLADLSQKAEVYDLIQKDVERVNKALPEPARIRRYITLPKEFDPDEAELTRTSKLRREFVEKQWANIIRGLYTEGTEIVLVESEVKYRDGRIGKVSSPAKVRTVE